MNRYLPVIILLFSGSLWAGQKSPEGFLRLTGTTTLPGTYSWNLETNHFPTDLADKAHIWNERISGGDAQLTLLAGTQYTQGSPILFEKIDPAAFKKSNWSSNPIPIEKGGNLLLKEGSVILIRLPNSAGYFALRIKRYFDSNDLDFPEARDFAPGWLPTLSKKPIWKFYHVTFDWVYLKPRAAAASSPSNL